MGVRVSRWKEKIATYFSLISNTIDESAIFLAVFFFFIIFFYVKICYYLIFFRQFYEKALKNVRKSKGSSAILSPTSPGYGFRVELWKRKSANEI